MNIPAASIDRLRALLGYRFPPLGRRAFNLFFRCMPPQADVQLFPGIHVPLHFSDDTQRATYWQGSRFDFPTAPFLARLGREATAFFDIGANYGFFSYWMLWKCPSIHVYAFDPVPSNIACMEEAGRRNNLASRFHVMGHALGDMDEVRPLRLGDADSGHSTLGAHTGLHGATIDVQIVPFDRWLERAGLAIPSQPQWLAKIDVEGFELNVLRGMEAALRRRVFRGLVVEVNEYTLNLFGHRPGDVFDFLERCGYAATGPVLRAKASPSSSYNAFFVPAKRDSAISAVN